jgi:hypothetical protein
MSAPVRRPGRPPLLGTAAPVAPMTHDEHAHWALAAARADLRAAQAILASLEQQLADADRPPPVPDAENLRWATVREAATYLRVDPSTLRDLLRRAPPEQVRRNQRLREVRVSLADLDRWVTGVGG